MGYLYAIITTLAWGFVVIPVKKASVSGFFAVGISLLAGLVITIPLSLIYISGNHLQISSFSGRNLTYICLAGIFQFPVATICYYESIRRMQISTAVPIKNLKIAVVLCLVFILGLETIELKSLLAMLIAITGATILAVNESKFKDNFRINDLTGLVFIIVAVVAWSIGDIFIKLAVGSISPILVTSIALLSGTFFYYLFILIKGDLNKIISISRYNKFMFIIHGIVSFGIGYLFFFSAIEKIGVGKTVIFTSSWPAISFLIGIFYFKEKLNMKKTIGFMLLILSAYLVI